MDKNTKQKLKETEKESKMLRKAIWDMLNYASMFVLLLDSKMNIRLINWSLATKLGFNNEKEAIGRCWLDFIKGEDKEKIKLIHKNLAFSDKNKYIEFVNDIIALNGESTSIKWFNTSVNSDYHMTFSFGIVKELPIEVTEESIRSYYRDIIEKDKTIIQTLRDSVLTNDTFLTEPFCEIKEGE